MKYLLDTHVLLWALENNPKLSTDVRELLRSASPEELCVSTVSLWEIAIKISIGKLKIAHSSQEVFALLKESEIVVLDITPEVAILVEKLPFHHKDPFDRLLICQAQYHNLQLVSDDSAFKSYAELNLFW